MFPVIIPKPRYIFPQKCLEVEILFGMLLLVVLTSENTFSVFSVYIIVLFLCSSKKISTEQMNPKYKNDKNDREQTSGSK